jgi:hypothetical protein
MRTPQQLEDLWRRHRYAKIFGVAKARHMLPHELLDSIAAATVDDDDFDETDADDNGNGDPDHLARVVVALQAAHPGLSKQTAYRWLIHTAHGRALTRHLYKRALRNGKAQTMSTTIGKESPIMDRTEQITALAKRWGAERVCKHFVDDNDAHGFSEFEITKMISDSVKRLPGETREMAFARVYQSEDGLVFRKAITLAKAFPQPMRAITTPMFTGGRITPGMWGEKPTVEDDALAQLNELTRRMRAAQPGLSEAEAFTRVYTDPNNAELAKRERMQNRPSAGR